MRLLILTLIIVLVKSDSCPSLCSCKWKSGKRTVECMERGLIKIPESVDAETQVLDMSVNNLQNLPKEVFVRLNLINLQKIYLKSCRLGQIDSEAFRGVTNLIELDLSSNLLTSVPTKSFQNTPFLRELLLANNPIQKIDPGAFLNLRGLVKLDLSNCEIKMVAPQAFEGIEMLELLKINDNHLSELRPHTVDILHKLHGVELHNNPWHCDCRLRVIKEWLLEYNIPYPISPKCLGGPERIIKKSFNDVGLEDLACKPELLPINRYVEAISGGNATISCRVNAVPPAQIKWFYNGKLLMNNSFLGHQQQKLQIFEQGSQEKRSFLVLHNTIEQDFIEFYCVAENRAGSAETNFTLRIISKPLGIISLNNGQIAGLSAALAALILIILIIISILLIKVRRFNNYTQETKTPSSQLEVVTIVNGPIAQQQTDSKPTQDISPDLINDHSGEYTRSNDASLYWDNSSLQRVTLYNDKSPIIEGSTSSEEGGYKGFPQDYGLPLPPQGKTLRVWQKGGIPVLPPVTALKRALSKNSPDEGYQEGGCGTDV
ncbi:unnamed protein product [Ceutorhynchus assimilis]|uniref:Ig-like domain-containing protein n=1 Tax=Ceutorhynchus assimilis TaxID=467358 RepID=A0A9N9MKA6_9CUCU|nr:unnamed protein product [Ceutorhynchus assimilis]